MIQGNIGKVLISLIVIILIAVFYLMIKQPIHNPPKMFEEVGIFKGSDSKKLVGRLCAVELENVGITMMSCPNKAYYIGQKILIYKTVSSSGAVSYKVPDDVEKILTHHSTGTTIVAP